MEIKRDRQIEFDIVQILKVLNDVESAACPRFESCVACPFGNLGVLDTFTCDEIKKLVKRLNLIYKVVETL